MAKQIIVRKLKNGVSVTINYPRQFRTVIVNNKPYCLKFPKAELTVKMLYRMKYSPTAKKYVKSNELQFDYLKFTSAEKSAQIPLPNITGGYVCLGKDIYEKSLESIVKTVVERFWTSRFEGLYGPKVTKFKRWVKNSQKPSKLKRPKPIDWNVLNET